MNFDAMHHLPNMFYFGFVLRCYSSAMLNCAIVFGFLSGNGGLSFFSHMFTTVEHAKRIGGGSSSMVHDGVIINYPSDRKPPSCLPGMEYHCERPVSSILCVQEYQDQEDMIFERYWAFSSLLVVPRILPLMFLICLSCVGGCVIARVALKRHPAHAKQRAFLREEGVNNLSSDEEANMSSSDNCGVSKGWHD